MAPLPRIGITTSLTEGEQRLDRRYVVAVEQAGAIPLPVPMTDSEEVLRAFCELLDGLWWFDEYRGEQVGEGRRSVAIRLRLQSPERQLTDADAEAVIDAVAPAVVTCRFTHVYPDGPAPYFTFRAAGRPGGVLDAWRHIKAAASHALIEAGGTITHHHAVGRDHAAWMRAEVGELGLDLIRAAKERLDPAGIMNPGKLLPA
jgi:FAD/FMN-containing dehydrogenase